MNKTIAAVVAALFIATPAIAEDLRGRGVVNRVDADRGTVNIAHEPIPALKWPAMTMDFKLKDKKLAAGVSSGQKVGFILEKDTAVGYVISRFENTK